MKDIVTFTEPAYIIFDTNANAVRTTVYGGLAIFSTKGMADSVVAHMPGCKVIPVYITPVDSKQKH